MVEFIKTLLGQAMKTNDSLFFAVLTGCLCISKESIFTGVKGLSENDIYVQYIVTNSCESQQHIVGIPSFPDSPYYLKLFIFCIPTSHPKYKYNSRFPLLINHLSVKMDTNHFLPVLPLHMPLFHHTVMQLCILRLHRINP